MPLVTQANYARRRGISREAVRQRTVTARGPIPVHGARKLIDPAEADALWEVTKSPAGASHGDGGGSLLAGSELARARAASLIVDVQTKRLVLEQRRGAPSGTPPAKSRRRFAGIGALRAQDRKWSRGESNPRPLECDSLSRPYPRHRVPSHA